MATTRNTVSSIIGSDIPRIDGPLKVTGVAKYAADHNLPGMLYAVPVCSTIANGFIKTLDTAAAEKMPGVKAIFRRENIGRFYRAAPNVDLTFHIDEKRPPFEDDTIRYHGQYVALAVATTLEQATAAADAVKVTYYEEKPDVRADLGVCDNLKVESERGDVKTAFAKAPVQIDQTYTTPPEAHAVIEAHASVAAWDGDTVTLYETSQAVAMQRIAISEMLGVPRENVRVITKFLGSGFGGKLWLWGHSLLTAAAARNLGQPVKLVITRKMMFATSGHRASTKQRIRLGATKDGKLNCLWHEYLNHTAILDEYKENCGEASGIIYSTPNARIANALVQCNVGSPTSMRGPGAVPGLYALESAMDELALKLNIDPVELRLRNDTLIDEQENVPFSSRHYKECLTVGAEKFGWAQRNPKVGSMKRDGLTLGWGMAGGSWIAYRFACELTIDLKHDGTARVTCGTQDIGTGTYTVLAQMISAKTGVSVGKVDVVLGDSMYPEGPTSGGSMATASLVPAVEDAMTKIVKKLCEIAVATKGTPFTGQKADDLHFTDGRIHLKDQDSATGTPYEEILKTANVNAASARGKSIAVSGVQPDKPKRSMHSFAAQFVEVTWQPETARLRVSRVVSVIDAGRIINKRTGTNQIQGAVVMGVGMALFERIAYDQRSGAPINSNLADYVLTTHADAPKIEVEFVEYPDLFLNQLGARGIGEIGLAGTAAAITAAVYHATGVRVRDLPVKIEDLIGSAASG